MSIGIPGYRGFPKGSPSRIKRVHRVHFLDVDVGFFSSVAPGCSDLRFRGYTQHVLRYRVAVTAPDTQEKGLFHGPQHGSGVHSVHNLEGGAHSHHLL
jgi:hypothetical protein